MQFFLLCPLLMLCLACGVRRKSLNRRLAKAAGTIVGAVTLYRAVIALDFKLPVPVFGPLDDQRALEHMTRTLQVSISISGVCSHLCNVVSVETCRPVQGMRRCRLHAWAGKNLIWRDVHVCEM